jgi:hypothetical protein
MSIIIIPVRIKNNNTRKTLLTVLGKQQEPH